MEYKDSEKLAQLVLEIPWGHNVLILQKTKITDERISYVAEILKKVAYA